MLPAPPPMTIMLASSCQFSSLTMAEMTEHHRQGLCYNYDEPLTVRVGAQCQRMFHLEMNNNLLHKEPEDEGTKVVLEDGPNAQSSPSMSSLSYATRTSCTSTPTSMVTSSLPSWTSSTHNFINVGGHAPHRTSYGGQHQHEGSLWPMVTMFPARRSTQHGHAHLSGGLHNQLLQHRLGWDRP